MSDCGVPATVGPMDGLSGLLAMYEHLMRETDPIALAVRQAKAAGRSAEQLEHDVLLSGAMKNEIRVMMRFTRSGKYGASALVPFVV